MAGGNYPLTPSLRKQQLAYFDVKLHGNAVGDGIADDTAAVQAAFNSSFPVRFPAGKYRITSTITQWVSNAGSRGRVIEGVAVTFHPPTMPRGTGSWLIWDGPADGVMLDTTGATGNEFANLTFVGRPTMAAANKVGAFIKTKNSTAPAYSSGESIIRNCSFYDGKVGLQCADDAMDGNAAGFLFDTCRFFNMDVGLLVNNYQGVQYQFENTTAGYCKHIWKFIKGGNAQWTGGNVFGCGTDDADGYPFYFGELAAGIPVQIIGLRVEQNTRRVLYAQGTGSVHLIGFAENNGTSTGQRMFDIRGCKVIMDGGRIFSTFNGTNDSVIAIQNNPSGNFRAQLTVKDMIWDNATQIKDIVQPANVASDCTVTLERVRTGAAHIPIPNQTNDIRTGPVLHIGSTTGTATANLVFAGWTRNQSSMARVTSGQTLAFDVHIVASNAAGTVYGEYRRRLLVRNQGGTTTQLGSTETVGTDISAGMAATPFTISVSDAWDAVEIVANGVTNETLSWRARLSALAV